MINTLLVEYLDLVVVGLLVAGSLSAVVLVQMKILPRPTLLFVAGAVLAAAGLTFASRWQKNQLLKELAGLNARIKQRDQELNDQRKAIKAQDQAVTDAMAEYSRMKAAYQKNILLLDAANEQERLRRSALTDDEVFREFDAAYPGSAAAGAGP